MTGVAMSSRADLDDDLARLTSDSTELAQEHERLRMINAEMLAAVESTLPILDAALSAVIDFFVVTPMTRRGSALASD